MIRFDTLLKTDTVRRLVAYREETGEDAVYLNVGPVELKVTSHQAMYFIPAFLVEEFLEYGVSFCVR